MQHQSAIQFKRPSGFYKLGNCYCLIFNGEIFISIGPDWIYNIVFTGFILIFLILFIYVVALDVSIPFQYLGLFIYLGALISYLLAAFKNPGIILCPWEFDLDDSEETKTDNLCKICRVCVEINSQHCEVCQVCIRNYHHHCPATGKCVGEGNLLPFRILLVCVVLGFVYFSLWVVFKNKTAKVDSGKN
jgi:hypothetical protein